MSRLAQCVQLGTKLFFAFALASLALCPKASAQLAACGNPPVQPCIPKFVDQLPYPPLFATTAVTVGGSPGDGYQIAGREILQQVLSTGTGGGGPLKTAVFAYGQNGFPYNPTAATSVCTAPTDSNCFFYPAPSIVALTGRQVQVKWIDDITCHTGDAFNGCTPATVGTFLPYPGVRNAGGVNPSFTNHTANPTGICDGRTITPSDCKGVGGYTGPVPFVVHLHGVVAMPESDGVPEAWSTPNITTFSTTTFSQTHGDDYCQTNSITGAKSCVYNGDGSSLFLYPNKQFGTLLFFHDHALGVTTENVYMGLAGAYILTGGNQSPSTWCNGNCSTNPFSFTDDLPSDCSPSPTCLSDGIVTVNSVTGGLPQGDCTATGFAQTPAIGCHFVPLVITDKAFNTDGSLKFSENGNVIVVNGKTWPFFNVEPRKYRFRVVIASPTSRFDLTFPSANNDNPGTPVATMTQIGADQGYLPHPAVVTKLSLMPGERADVIVDFQQFFGCAPPYGPGCTVDLLNANGSGDTGTIMRFNIVPFAGCDVNNPAPATCTPFFGADTSCNLPFLKCTKNDTLPHRTSGYTTTVRQVSLFDDHLGSCGALNANTKCVSSTPLPWDGTVTETPRADATEIWEMYDFMDSHPMHLHLASFEVLNRESMSTHKVYNCADMAKNALGQIVPCSSAPVPGETGFKDTVQANGGQITRVMVLFPVPDGTTYPGLFAWHCHINPHEDNEMMRPLCVEDVVNPAGSACLGTR
jgi:spore coat protein A, manganese oxidase